MKFIVKKTYKLFSLLFISVVLLSLNGCDDFLTEDSIRLAATDEYDINAAGATDNAYRGMLVNLQKLVDSYVLLGDLRADLMTVGEESDPSLVEINNLDITKENKYVKVSDYYAVINNCNFYISKLDTNKMEYGEKIQIYYYTAMKAVRAWTYMQLALNYKTVSFYTTPILSQEDANKTYPQLEMIELCDTLINDLLPLSYFNSGGAISLRAVLGDLYLWRGTLTDNSVDYLSAATIYRKLLYDNNSVIGSWDWRISKWTIVNNSISTDATLSWINNMRDENVSAINCPTEYGQTYSLDTLANRMSIAPTNAALQAWDNQTYNYYYLNSVSSKKGDLRKWGSVSWSKAANKEYQWDLSFKKPSTEEFHVYKYKAYFQNVPIHRVALIYLRYAEAVNRLEKPNLAFAVLKYGLNNLNLTNIKIIPQKERVDGRFPDFMNFSDSRFTSNIGIRMRSLGNSDKDTTYVIKSLPSMQDSILFVEDKIIEELGLETAFEGNRYHDLMRFVYRRKVKGNENGDAFQAKVADMIATKHTENAETIKNKLVLSLDNWYIKY